MIEKVIFKNFKQFADCTFELKDQMVLAGPNNMGKTTLLQGIALWVFALNKWCARKENRLDTSGEKTRTGVMISSAEFLVIPIKAMELLWTNTQTAFRRSESPTQAPGSPKEICIEIHARDQEGHWTLGMEFRYGSTEHVWVRPSGNKPRAALIQRAKKLTIVHVPAFSGIGSREEELSESKQQSLIGQGKPGDIVRNLLKSVWEKDRDSQEKRGISPHWNALVRDIREIFSYELQAPLYGGGRVEIDCHYTQVSDKAPHGKRARSIPIFDIVTAGSGFHQVLMLLAFLYAKPGVVLMLDEPDAHLHTVLQGQIYDRLRDMARGLGGQLLIASHSEVFIDRTDPGRLMSFYGTRPHVLDSNTSRDGLREALKRLTSRDLLQAESERVSGFLYVEAESDLALLKAWAEALNHPLTAWFKQTVPGPSYHCMNGKNPKEAKAHLFALRQGLNKPLTGFILLDNDNQTPEPFEEEPKNGIHGHVWERYEIENYLLHPTSLARFVIAPAQGRTDLESQAGLAYLRKQLPPHFFVAPLDNSETLKAVPASKKLLPEFLAHVGLSDLRKGDYYRIAQVMQPEEIHPEVVQVLDRIAQILSPSLPTIPSQAESV
jgi:predicted ATPase